jgi:hypothetical protein
MGILRYWLTGERDEIDKEWLVINLYNRRRKVDPACKNAPRGENMSRPSTITLPECILLEIVEAYTILTSWGISTEEALARIETYRAQYYGAGVFPQTYNLASYLEYRLLMEKADWPRSANLSQSLIRHGVEKCRRFFAKFPPVANAVSPWDPFETVHIPRASLLAPVNDIVSESHAVGQHERQCIDQLQIYSLKGDSQWRFFHNTKGAHWVYQGFALLRGDAIVKAVVISETRYHFRPLKQPQ